MRRVRHSALVLAALASAGAHRLPAQGRGADSTLVTGIGNRGRNAREPYVTAGDRAYLIGTQDGRFPDQGGHVPGEMGGLWLHPIKLIDGFQATLADSGSRRDATLAEARAFVAYPYGSRFDYGAVLDGVTVERFEFSPDGEDAVVVRYTFRNATDRRRRLSFRLAVKTELMPVWWSDSLGIHDAPDSVRWDPPTRTFVARDSRNPWFCIWGATEPTGAQRVATPDSLRTAGLGVTAASRHSVAIPPRGTATLTFVIAGSPTSEAAARRAFSRVAARRAQLLARKKAHYATLLARARITIPDRRLQEVYDWVRVNTEWLVRDVPGMGRAFGGGLMEYPWFFPDMYSVQALAATGDFDLAKETLRLFRRESAKANGNGRIVHEVTTAGFVSNHGNTQETAQYVMAVGRLVARSGDTAFAREMYPAMRQGLHWLLVDKDTNGDLFPEGYGIMEVLGLNAELIDAAVYTQQALEETSRVAALLHDPVAAARYDSLGSVLKRRIDDRFWLEDSTSYADFYGTRAQAVSAAEGAAKQIALKGEDKLTARDRELIAHYDRVARSFAAMPDTSRGWITNENWVIATPVEMGIAPRAKAVRLLDRVRRKNVGEYGPWLSAVERQAMMTISTGVEAVAEARYGRVDEALWYMNRIVETFGRRSPGTISEMMPDYGCFVISWTNYGIVVPLVEDIFGIRPDAVRRTVVVAPHVPTGWENMAIADLPVGTTAVSFSRARTARGIEYTVAAKDDGWTFVFESPEPAGARYYVNGRPVRYDAASGLRLSGRSNVVLVVR